MILWLLCLSCDRFLFTSCLELVQGTPLAALPPPVVDQVLLSNSRLNWMQNVFVCCLASSWPCLTQFLFKFDASCSSGCCASSLLLWAAVPRPVVVQIWLSNSKLNWMQNVFLPPRLLLTISYSILNEVLCNVLLWLLCLLLAPLDASPPRFLSNSC